MPADKPPKPCPFCGSHYVEPSPSGEYAPIARWITCRDCGADGPTADTPAEAVDAWNDRTTGSGGGGGHAR